MAEHTENVPSRVGDFTQSATTRTRTTRTTPHGRLRERREERRRRLRELRCECCRLDGSRQFYVCSSCGRGICETCSMRPAGASDDQRLCCRCSGEAWSTDPDSEADPNEYDDDEGDPFEGPASEDWDSPPPQKRSRRPDEDRRSRTSSSIVQGFRRGQRGQRGQCGLHEGRDRHQEFQCSGVSGDVADYIFEGTEVVDLQLCRSVPRYVRALLGVPVLP